MAEHYQMQLAAYKNGSPKGGASKGGASKGGASKGGASKHAGKRKAAEIVPKSWEDMDSTEQRWVREYDNLRQAMNDAKAA